MEKRGAVEIQFNWVFVLIAGALILVFFVSIVNVQRRAADRNLAFDILSKMDLIMSGALTVSKAGQIFDMPRAQIDFECNRITLYGVSRQFQDKVVFSPNVLKGRRLIVQSLDFNVPFKVSNFLYLTTSDVRYIFVGDDDFTRNLFENFPQNATKEIVSSNEISNLQDKNNYKIRFVFVSPTNDIENIVLPQFIKNMKDDAVSAVKIDKERVKFYKKKNNGFVSTPEDEFSYLHTDTNAMIYGAIFSENSEIFKCAVDKAFKRLKYVALVYAEKEEKLKDEVSQIGRSDCLPYRAADEMNGLANYAQDKAITGIEGLMETLSNLNKGSLERSCPSVY